MRVGIGYDSHRFTLGRPLILGGVHVPFDLGLEGHSDADVVAHAVTDAILGAAALGDIGAHFPPSDARWKDADSIELLRAAARILEERNYQVVNVDVSVVLEQPKLRPHVDAMRARLADALGISPDNVSIKAKTNEQMGWVGRGEGVAGMAVALIDAVRD
ncbi:MAG TPA: 2-C-methyl-D-erythritol 2,4-cyclodiphosphate synthase [Longimicrobiales bacterium]